MSEIDGKGFEVTPLKFIDVENFFFQFFTTCNFSSLFFLVPITLITKLIEFFFSDRNVKYLNWGFGLIEIRKNTQENLLPDEER